MSKTIIIAEAGVNHNGDIEIAKRLIDAAEQAGADYIKFQTFVSEDCIAIHAVKADYQIKNTGVESESQLEMVKKLELNESDHDILTNYCKNKQVKFLSTAFDFSSIKLLNKYNLDFFKVASSELTNLPFLRNVADLQIPIIISTGMANMQEVKDSLDVFYKKGIKKENITVLHCNTEYPTPMGDVNLNAMLTLKNELGVKIGYSDHSLGIEVPIAAVALGAQIIEKHFTLDNNMIGPDHRASLEPDQLTAMVSAIRNIEIALGSGIKEPTPSEMLNIPVMRKSIVAKTEIKKGEIFNEDNLCVKRPGVGINSMKWDEIIGLPANFDFQPDELIKL